MDAGQFDSGSRDDLERTMGKKTRRKEFPARRKFALRRDASVGSGQREIESVFDLPRGSVRLLLPDGSKARSDKAIGALLSDWER